ncbi:MAG: LVIVD repeat-containing protein [Actinomycetota bacterium]
MRRRIVAALASLSLLAVWPGSPVAAQVSVEDPTGLLASDNVSFETTLPNPGVIGAHFKGDVMFVTTLTGLTTYDVSNPAAPQEIGRLALPHFQNEDVDLGGDILLISNDAAESTGILYVIDISDPANPSILATHQMGGNPLLGGPGHTASCVLDCRYAWVTDGGSIRVIDLTDPANPVNKGTFATPAGGDVATHDVQVDANGLYWVVGFGGATAYQLPRAYSGEGLGTVVAQTDASGRSTYFEEFGLGDGGNPNDFVLHNSHRRRNDDVVFITEEDYTRPACQGAGSLGAWQLPVDKRGRPTGAELSPLDQWVPELLEDSTPTAAVCSAHYFDLEANVVAQGWYEMGLRLLDVSDPTDIRQVGYFVPRSAMTWSAYFPPTDPTGEIVYVADATHGIDVIRWDRPDEGPLSMSGADCRNPNGCKPKTRQAPVRDEWRASPTSGIPNGSFGYACRLNVLG